MRLSFKSVLFGMGGIALLFSADVTASPATDHPRLWVRSSDLTTLRNWARGSTNPFYQQGIAILAAQAKADMDAGLVPASDSGGITWSEYPTEMYAELFAFMSLIENAPGIRIDYARHRQNPVNACNEYCCSGCCGR